MNNKFQYPLQAPHPRPLPAEGEGRSARDLAGQREGRSAHGFADERGEDAFGVYVHWPFCAQKCPYCDFNSHVRHKGWDEERFFSAYKREIDWIAERIGPRAVTSIFFGGGTPSLMQPQTVAGILDHIAKRWGIARDAEITLEANPGSVEAQRFRGFRDAGINRVSIGVQSLRDNELRKLGRIHTVAEAKTALDIARSTFERFSFDLIYARPGQTADEWRRELQEALDLAGDHLSLYQLTIEPDTPYAALHAAGKLVIPDEYDASALYEITEEMTAARGFTAYEVSNYARPGSESRHNLLYWRYGEYAGAGPGAHGRLVAGGGREATMAERNPEAWAALVEENGNGIVELTSLSQAEQADEMLLMGLRLSEGLDMASLAEIGGVRPSAAAISELSDLGLLQVGPVVRRSSSANGHENERDEIVACAGPGLAPEAQTAVPVRIRVTPQGRLVLNAVVAKLSNSFQRADGMDKLKTAV